MKKNILVLLFVSLLHTTCAWGMKKNVVAKQNRKPFAFPEEILDKSLPDPFTDKDTVWGALFVFLPDKILLELRGAHPILYIWIGEFTKKYNRAIKIKQQTSSENTSSERWQCLKKFINNFNCKSICSSLTALDICDFNVTNMTLSKVLETLPKLQNLDIWNTSIIQLKGLELPPTLKCLCLRSGKNLQDDVEYLQKTCPKIEEVFCTEMQLVSGNRAPKFCWEEVDTQGIIQILKILTSLKKLTIRFACNKNKIEELLETLPMWIKKRNVANATIVILRENLPQPQQ